MAALCVLQFCSWALLSKKKKKKKGQSSGGMDSSLATVTDTWIGIASYSQQKWDHSLIPVSSAALQELGHPSGRHLALSENMQLQPGCGVWEKCLGVLSGGRKVPAALQVCTKRIGAAKQEEMEVWKGTSEGRKPIVKVSGVKNSAGRRPLLCQRVPLCLKFTQ